MDRIIEYIENIETLVKPKIKVNTFLTSEGLNEIDRRLSALISSCRESSNAEDKLGTEKKLNHLREYFENELNPDLSKAFVDKFQLLCDEMNLIGLAALRCNQRMSFTFNVKDDIIFLRDKIIREIDSALEELKGNDNDTSAD